MNKLCYEFLKSWKKLHIWLRTLVHKKMKSVQIEKHVTWQRQKKLIRDVKKIQKFVGKILKVSMQNCEFVCQIKKVLEIWVAIMIKLETEES